jgi:phosphoserine phosphatase
VLIVRLIADTGTLADAVAAARDELAARGWPVAMAEPVVSGSSTIELQLPRGEAGEVRAILDRHCSPCDLLVTEQLPAIPRVFVSDMDSTMIAAECIDELADFAGLKDRVAAITQRAMQGELDFAAALHERVGLLAGLDEEALSRCLAERIAPMPGAAALVATLKAHGCRTVLVTGGFHHFADPVAEQLGFDHVIANRLEVADGKLTGRVTGDIVDSAGKRATLIAEAAALGEGAESLAMGDGANDIPMLQAASLGIAFRAKPKARAAAHGWIDRGDLTAALDLLGIPRQRWLWE